MDAVAAADGRRVPVLQCALLQRGQQAVDVADQEVGGLGELDGEAGVQNVRRGHAGRRGWQDLFAGPAGYCLVAGGCRLLSDRESGSLDHPSAGNRNHELSPHLLLRDTRTIGMKIVDFFKDPINSSISMFTFATATFVFPSVCELFTLIGICVFFYAYTRKATLPFRMVG